MQRARARWSAEKVVAAGILIFAVSTMMAGTLHRIPELAAVMLAGGAAWIVFISLFNVLVLNLTPDWVRARVLAITMLVFQGGMAAGSATWGAVAAHWGIHSALLWSGLGTMATASLGLFLRLPEGTVDLTPWNHWKMPATDEAGILADDDAGPVMVTVEYDVIPERTAEFIKAMHEYGRIRRRDGASRWGIFRDVESVEHFVETFIVASWAEHLRQHERMTQADRELEDLLRNFVRNDPTVRHLIYAQ
jgi:MFS family permease